MKKLILIALLFSFFFGNAQNSRQHFGPNNIKEASRLSYEIEPGLPAFSDTDRNQIKKTDDNPHYPIFTDQDMYTIRETEAHPGGPVLLDLNRNRIRKTDYHIDPNVFMDKDRYSMKKTD
jgi:hypothetical protein